MTTTAEKIYATMARAQFGLHKERLRSLVERAEVTPEAVRDSLDTTDSHPYAATVTLGGFFVVSPVTTRLTTVEGDRYDLDGEHDDWWPGPPTVLLGPPFFSSSGSAEMNYPIQDLVGRGFRYLAFFTGAQSSVTWRGTTGEHLGVYVGSPIGFWPPYGSPDIHVAWGGGTVRAASDRATARQDDGG
ncbi:hypothetical protein [Streptomyces sp. NPDC057702]|uniref:hypothetical protein n=1 Tax=unclassified Streptomyces TaxID=2593676 RepID=UPI0036AF7815